MRFRRIGAGKRTGRSPLVRARPPFPPATAIVKTIIGLGHSLGLRVLAEGVEDRETLECLAALDCDHAQGFFISRAIPPAELEVWAMKSILAPKPS